MNNTFGTLRSWLIVAVAAVICELAIPNISALNVNRWDMSPFEVLSFGTCIVAGAVAILVMALIAYLYGLRVYRISLADQGARDRQRSLRSQESWTLRVGVATIGLATIVLWSICTAKVALLASYILPAPTLVFMAYREGSSVFLPAALHSGIRLLLAFVIAVLGGMSGGIVVGRVGAARYLTPYTRMLAVIPPLVLIPLFTYLFSKGTAERIVGTEGAGTIPSLVYEETFRIAVVSFAAFWAIFSGTLHASLNTSAALVQVSDSLGFSWFRKVKTVIVPLALPQVFRDAGIGLTIGFIVLISVEGSGSKTSTQGLGALIGAYDATNAMPGLTALILLVTVVITAFHWILDLLNKRLTPWQSTTNIGDQRGARDVSPEVIKVCTQKLLESRRSFPLDEERIVLKDVRFAREGRPILTIDRQLSARSGELVAIIGESGSGKTTLSRIVAGFDRADDGTVFVNGVNLDSLRGSVTPGVAFMFQDYALMPHLTVEQNLTLVFQGNSANPDLISMQVQNITRLVRLDHCLETYPDRLSGGERQRLALARALLMDQPILVVDEGLSSIDQPSKSLLRSAVRQITKALNLTTLYISHDREDVLQVADRIWYLKGGRVVADDTPREMYYHASSLEAARFLGHTNLFEATVMGRSLILSKRADSLQTTASATFVLPESASVLKEVAAEDARTVVVCIPKNWIQVGVLDSDGVLEVEGLLEDAMFSGTEWELRIRVAGGTEFDVVMQDADYQKLQRDIAAGISADPKSKAQMSVKDACVLGLLKI